MPMLLSGFSMPDFTISDKRNPFLVVRAPSSTRSAGVRNVSKSDLCGVAIFTISVYSFPWVFRHEHKQVSLRRTEHGDDTQKKCVRQISSRSVAKNERNFRSARSRVCSSLTSFFQGLEPQGGSLMTP